jgi:uncharacterized protein (TIGR01777 family)
MNVTQKSISMHKIVITGGSGLVGQYLTQMLMNEGYEVAHLGRSKRSGQVKSYVWNIEKGYIEPEALQGTTHIIHLAGAGVADHRWTDDYKREIYDSRIQSTRLLFESLKNQPERTLQKFISASAIGIYGNHTADNTPETAPAANTFLARVCADWEQQARQFEQLNIPVAIVRVGVVLAREGGFVKEVGKPIKALAGAALGSGKQATSWIHIHDLCRIFFRAVHDDTFTGVWNGVAPHPATNSELTHLLAKELKRPILLPNVPEFAMKLLFGEMHTMLLAHQHVSAQKLLNAGFQFQFPTAAAALSDLCSHTN